MNRPFNDRFLRACRGEEADCTPVWFMRQAGRYLPEYRALRERYTLQDLCTQPELCAQVTLLPVRALGVDAAILFSDITLPLGPMGVRYRIAEGVGPVVENPLRRGSDLERLRPLEPEEDLPFVMEAIRGLVRALEVPLIGFAGGPFTLACYLVEGGPSRSFYRTRALMCGEPALWHRLMDLLSESMARYLLAQARAGASALQVFDSWVGVLSPEDYRGLVLPYVRRLFARLREGGVPVIYFGVGTAGLLDLMAGAGPDVLGLDWRVDLGRAWAALGFALPVQGNLDPACLLGPWEGVERRARDVLRGAGGRRGHIFNLGHGVLPETPPEHLQRLVEMVHTETARKEREA